MFTNKSAVDKLHQLIETTAKEKNLTPIEIIQDEEDNAHVLFKKNEPNKYGGDYIVWSSYFTGEEKTTFKGFHNGSYDLSLSNAVEEMKRRLNRDTI